MPRWVWKWGIEADGQWSPPATTVASTGPTTPTSALSEIAGGVYDFVQGGIAGAVGAFVVFPIDLVSSLSRASTSTKSQGQNSNSKSKVQRCWGSFV